MKLKPYPKYKDSGIEWIGEIPEGWDIKRCSFYIKPFMGYPFDSNFFDYEGFPLIRIRDLLNQEIETCFSGEYPKEYVIKKGDHLIGMDGDFHSTIWDSKNGLLNQRVMKINIIKKSQLHRKFFYYLINEPLKIINDLTYSTTVKHLSDEDIRKLPIQIPPLEEQTAIASFLDNKTSQINKLIEKNQKLIELLKEKRTALINHAVTKGLDPNAKMKDSGIEWIGEIPEGWEVRKLKFVSKKITTGKTPPSENYGYYDAGEINWFTPRDMGDEFILKESARKITSLALLENKTIKYQPKTVLLVGIGATLGKVGMITDIGTSNQQINAIQFDESKISPKYGLYYFYGYKNAIISLSNTSIIGIFNQTQTANFFIIIPPLTEQTAITSYLDKATEKIDKTIKLMEKKIELLEEYKKSLIHHVVTGKVDVREVEA